MKNSWGKMRKVEEPYLTLRVDDWCWKVLKAWQSGKGDMENRYARWFCCVTSPFTSGDFGDVYVVDIIQAAHRAGLEQEVLGVIKKRRAEEEQNAETKRLN